MTREDWDRLIDGAYDRAMQRMTSRSDEIETLRQEIEALRKEHHETTRELLRIIAELLRLIK